MATEPTAVTNLIAVATSNQSIQVSWHLPVFPNGPTLHYNLFYQASDTPQNPPNVRSDGYTVIVGINTTNFEITGLMPYTNYTIHVRAIGQGNLLGDIDEEILQRTNSTIQLVMISDGPTPAPTTNTITIHLPDPSQVETGLVM